MRRSTCVWYVLCCITCRCFDDVLGNTCFLNSAVQCLSLTRPLTDYFLLDMYAREINTTSMFGMKGQMAIAYAKTLKLMWSSRSFDAISPKNLKWTIGKFRPQFVGSQQ